VRRLLADLTDGRTTGDVTTLGDPTTLATLRERLAAHRGAMIGARSSSEALDRARLDNTVREGRG
jgi:hypothetical protein